MKTLVAAIFIAGVSLAGLAPAQAISPAPLGKDAKAMTMVEEVAKACRRGYQLTPRGCRRIKSR